MREATVQDAIRVDAARWGIFLWRNNSGVLNDEDGRPVRFGLGNDSPRLNEKFKSSDLIGIQTGTGRFVAIECKAPTWIGVRTQRERAQEAFIDCVKRNGGIAGFCRSVDEFRALVMGAV